MEQGKSQEELAVGLKFRDKPDGTGSVRSPVRLGFQSYSNRSWI